MIIAELERTLLRQVQSDREILTQLVQNGLHTSFKVYTLPVRQLFQVLLSQINKYRNYDRRSS